MLLKQNVLRLGVKIDHKNEINKKIIYHAV